MPLTLLLLTLGQAPLTVTLQGPERFDASVAWPQAALQPAATTINVPGAPEVPLVVWRDDRPGPWVLMASSLDGVHQVAVEAEGELRAPQVTSNDVETWFAWEVLRPDGGLAVRACQRSPVAAGTVPQCPLTVTWEGRHTPRVPSNGGPWLGMLSADGGIARNLRDDSEHALTLAANALDFSFWNPIAAGPSSVFAEYAAPDGGNEVSFWPGAGGPVAGTQPRLLADSSLDRTWIDGQGHVARFVSGVEKTPLGVGCSKPWGLSGPPSVLAYLSGGGVEWLNPDFGSFSAPQTTVVDFAPLPLRGGVSLFAELVSDGHTLRQLEIIASASTPVDLDLVRPTFVVGPAGTATPQTQLVAWRSPAGLEFEVSGAGIVTHGTRPGLLRDFALTSDGRDLYAGLVDAAGNAGLAKLNSSRAFDSPDLLARAARRVAVASNGNGVQYAVLGMNGQLVLAHRSGSGDGDFLALQPSGVATDVQLDCLSQGACATTYALDGGAVFAVLAGDANQRRSLQPGERLLALGHDRTGFLAVQRADAGLSVSRLTATGAALTSLTFAADDAVILSGDPALLVAQQADDRATLRVLRLDTFDETTATVDAGLRLAGLVTTPPTNSGALTPSPALLFETRDRDAIYGAALASVPGRIDAGVVRDAGAPVDAGPPLDGGASPDAGTTPDAGAHAAPVTFAVCSCDAAPAGFALALMVLLRRRPRLTSPSARPTAGRPGPSPRPAARRAR